MITIPAHVDILAVAQRYSDVSSKQVATTHGGEHWGSCPLCGTGRNRFHVWPNRPREDGPAWWCRQCNESGDIIKLVQLCEGVSFRMALEILEIEPEENWQDYQPREPLAPCKTWQDRAKVFVHQAQKLLWVERGGAALEHLRKRGLSDDVIRDAQLGYVPLGKDGRWLKDSLENWGLSATETGKECVWLPEGILIPWFDASGHIWKLNVRKLGTLQKHDRRYQEVLGSGETMYNLYSIQDGKPVVLVEGELDAISGSQEAGALAVFVATSGAAKMYPQHIPALERASRVLVAFDLDENGAGDNGADYWLQHIPQAMRCDPWSHDLNDMLKEGKSLREWLETGLALAQCDVEIDEPVAPADTRQEWKQKLDELFDIPEEKAMT